MSTKHLHHADHNSKLARKLLEEGEFYDWSVTTPFYACSHYIKYYLFPLEDHGIDKMPGSIESLDEYCSLKGGVTDKHGALYDLFQDKCTNRGIDVDFRKLMNDCWMANTPIIGPK